MSPAALCGWAWTHLYTLCQDLNEQFLGEHTAQEPGLASDTGADTEPALRGPGGERAGGNLSVGEGSGVRVQHGALTTPSHTGHVTSGKSYNSNSSSVKWGLHCKMEDSSLR